jgi:hypothetical protein
MRQASGTYRGALHIIAGVMLVSAVLPVLVSPPRDAPSESRGQMPSPLLAKNSGRGNPRAAH